jgi:hypothetical protein
MPETLLTIDIFKYEVDYLPDRLLLSAFHYYLTIFIRDNIIPTYITIRLKNISGRITIANQARAIRELVA